MWKLSIALATMFFGCAAIAAPEQTPDAARDILVTFSNGAAESTSAGLGPPYMRRKRYTISRQARQDAAAVAAEYSLTEIDHWPIQSLAVYCFVYRVPEGTDRQSIIARLNADPRIESAQPLQIFEVSTERQDTLEQSYDDAYANLQYGLDILHVAAAHRTTRGAGVRVVIIDSDADRDHEDLRGQIKRIREFSGKGQVADRNHGTAVASIIGARSNNSLGIVGVAPEATLEVYVSCWSAGTGNAAICDTFSLSKALDAVLENPPHVLNLSLTGPYDPLLERLLQKVFAAGVVVIAAGSAGANLQNSFPSNMQQVIGVDATPTESWTNGKSNDTLFAPGDRILVALPSDRYDFRSGSSLAAAHVSGVVALVLAVAPHSSSDAISSILLQSQSTSAGSIVSINACVALYLTGSAQNCND
ncbi:MAG: S8 family serine peptidase [Gammaproteobacteria bacterium]|nr:S8 family serine peptidase [Gammaproteobacteria bacterium]MDH5303520.1 S8 family serine peptidase [Gammaproteobacteria bacterium]MDH5321862.1 S8 family serine peptidase [Gammaproteobacteria bacterium]